MTKRYTALRCVMAKPNITLAHPPQTFPERVSLDTPAVDCMTDFNKVSALTVDYQATIDDANRKMIEHGVRLLVVMDKSNKVCGIITAGDISGEKPLQRQQERGITRSEILVSDIMTPHTRLDVMLFEDVRAAKVGHVVATLRKYGRRHAVVVESGAGSEQTVRGLFSLTQIARQLGVPMHVTKTASTFAEIETMLGH